MAKKLTKKQKRMQKIVEGLQEFVATYDMQEGYLDYSDRTFIDDMLYGIAIALDKDKYSYAGGFGEFREFLRKHLG